MPNKVGFTLMHKTCKTPKMVMIESNSSFITKKQGLESAGTHDTCRKLGILTN